MRFQQKKSSIDPFKRFGAFLIQCSICLTENSFLLCVKNEYLQLKVELVIREQEQTPPVLLATSVSVLMELEIYQVLPLNGIRVQSAIFEDKVLGLYVATAGHCGIWRS